MLPQFMSVDLKSRANRWAGVPGAVYKLDLDALGALEEKDREVAVAKILDWMANFENPHDAWVLTPSRYTFAMDKPHQHVEGEDDERDELGTEIGNCLMPMRYSLVDPENSRRCMLTCTDGAPFKESSLVKDDWTAFSNSLFYHKDDKERSENSLCNMLMAAAMACDSNSALAEGPVVLSFF